MPRHIPTHGGLQRRSRRQQNDRGARHRLVPQRHPPSPTASDRVGDRTRQAGPVNRDEPDAARHRRLVIGTEKPGSRSAMEEKDRRAGRGSPLRVSQAPAIGQRQGSVLAGSGVDHSHRRLLNIALPAQSYPAGARSLRHPTPLPATAERSPAGALEPSDPSPTSLPAALLACLSLSGWGFILSLPEKSAGAESKESTI
jgi:hypothetical protein